MNNSVVINNKSFKIPRMLFVNKITKPSNQEIKEGLIFNKNLLMENFIIPNGLKFPLFRNVLENYYN